MTPYEINILLHYYARAVDHEDVLRDPPIAAPTFSAFIDADLLVFVAASEREARFPMSYRLTDRGRAYCDALQRVPLPEQHWLTAWDELAKADLLRLTGRTQEEHTS